MHYRGLSFYITSFFICFLSTFAYGQEAVSVVPLPQNNPTALDTTQNTTNKLDSISSDSLEVTKAVPKESALDYPIAYQATDSIVFHGDGTAYFYKEGVVIYKQPKTIELKADFIRMKTDSSTIYASGVTDSLGNVVGNPQFKDGEGDGEYNSKFMSYNFKTGRGYIRGAVTQQGEGYIIADQTKKSADGQLYMKSGQYTTCDHHDHPHFYLQLTKAKVKPGGFIAAGPAYMVIEDVPLPLALPFGFFPISSTYSSGIIMPTFGDELERGFFLRDGGYYFAINDYVDLAVTGEIFTKGTWAINGASTYKKRYKFYGNVNISYREDISGEKNLPGYVKSKNFRASWRHTQDPKASQYNNLSASVDFTTSGYNQSNINNYYNPAIQSQNITSSSVNFTQRFPESPWSLSVNASVTQRAQDSTISLTLPTFSATMSRIYPFKRKQAIGKERFYEKISLSYNMIFENAISTKENLLFSSSLAKDWKNGIRHSIPIAATFTALKYLNITPSVNYTSRWYFNKVDRDWNIQNQQEQLDTLNGFYRVYDFNAAVSFNTRLYGFYTPSRKIFGDKIDQIRHVLTPNMSFVYSPDFADPMWGFYKSYEKVIVDKANMNPISREQIIYSPYSGGKYGVPGRGTNSSLTFSLANNLEMKVKDKSASDTTGTDVFKKVSLIDNFMISGAYNFAADSLNWSNFNASLRLKLTKNFALNLSGAFDPYMYGLNEAGAPIRVNKLRWNHGQFPRFLGTGTSFQYTFNNDTFKPKNKQQNTQDKPEEDNLPEVDEYGFELDPNKQQDNDKKSDEPTETDAEGYEKPNIQWSLSFNYLINWGKLGDFDYEIMDFRRGITSHSLTLSGYINPTAKWKINYNATLDLKAQKLTNMTLAIVRDLHCWNMSASISPIGMYKSFMITIGVNASILRDLKYDKRSDNSSNASWL